MKTIITYASCICFLGLSTICDAAVERQSVLMKVTEVKLINGCRLTKENKKLYLYIEPGCGRFRVVSLPKKSSKDWAVYKIEAVLGGWVDIDGDGELERKSLIGKVIRIKVAEQVAASDR